ncbi:MAG: PIG-L deacetylase family protein [Bacillota bacterium]
MFWQGTRILMVGAHPDDIELGCGGTIARLVNRSQIRCLVLSDRMESGNPRDLQEMYASLGMLGIIGDKVNVARIPTRIFTDYRPAIREALINERKHFIPEVVFFPSTGDLHQDHQVLYDEVRRIFRNETLLGYEIIRSSDNFHPQLYVQLEEDHLRRKIAALKHYRSQTAGRQSAGYYFQSRVIRTWALFHGTNGAMRYAEAYEVYCIRLLGRESENG